MSIQCAPLCATHWPQAQYLTSAEKPRAITFPAASCPRNEMPRVATFSLMLMSVPGCWKGQGAG